MLVNQELQWELFLPPEPTFSHIHFLASHEPHQPFNIGVFFVRVSDLAVDLLMEASALRFHKPAQTLWAPEQDAVNLILETETYKDHVIFQVHSIPAFLNTRCRLHIPGIRD